MTAAIAALARGVVVAGFDGTAVPEPFVPLAGWLLFARNGTAVAQVRALSDALRARYAGGVAPLIAIDQEGGRVARLREGLEALPSAMALGAAGDVALAERVGEQLGFDLRRAGCSLDFAPVLDLALDPRNTVIGTRAFGDAPARVSELGAALAAGMERAGTIACFKHFPGHGATADDSHVGAARIAGDAAGWRARDLAPFAAVAPRARAIMSAHVTVEAVDPSAPASRSYVLSTGLLRGELGFDGVLVTDCLFMRGADARGDVVAAALAALRAGADLLTVSHGIATAAAVVDAIVGAVEAGTLELRRLEEAAARVARLRAQAAPPLPLEAPPPHRGVGREAARRAVTLMRGVPHADPVASSVWVFRAATGTGAEDRRHAAASLRDEAPALEEQALPLAPSDADVDAALTTLAASGRRAIVLMQRAHRHPEQVRAVERVLARNRDAVVVSTAEPFDLECAGAARHLLACYGDDRAALAGLADVLFGGSMPQGRLPVELARAR